MALPIYDWFYRNRKVILGFNLILALILAILYAFFLKNFFEGNYFFWMLLIVFVVEEIIRYFYFTKFLYPQQKALDSDDSLKNTRQFLIIFGLVAIVSFVFVVINLFDGVGIFNIGRSSELFRNMIFAFIVSSAIALYQYYKIRKSGQKVFYGGSSIVSSSETLWIIVAVVIFLLAIAFVFFYLAPSLAAGR